MDQRLAGEDRRTFVPDSEHECQPIDRRDIVLLDLALLISGDHLATVIGGTSPPMTVEASNVTRRRQLAANFSSLIAS
jgi:hypothetical protein